MIKCRTWPWGNAISFFIFSASCTWIPMDSSRQLHQKTRTCVINLLRVLLLNKHQIIKKTHTKQAKIIPSEKGSIAETFMNHAPKPQAKIFWDEGRPTTICPKSRPHVVEVLLHLLDLNIEIASYLIASPTGFLVFAQPKKKTWRTNDRTCRSVGHWQWHRCFFRGKPTNIWEIYGNLLTIPRDPITLSDNDWDVQSPPQKGI